jgi:hypothetical protein
MDNENEFQADLQQDLDQEEAAIPEITPAQHWDAIKSLAQTIVDAGKDLQDQLDNLHKPLV